MPPVPIDSHFSDLLRLAWEDSNETWGDKQEDEEQCSLSQATKSGINFIFFLRLIINHERPGPQMKIKRLNLQPRIAKDCHLNIFDGARLPPGGRKEKRSCQNVTVVKTTQRGSSALRHVVI